MEIKEQVAIIQESDCIGCTKCIRACPVDAILGAAKQMHTVIYNECTGCELCISSCPVNCITLISTIKPNEIEYAKKTKQAQERFDFHNFRLQRDIPEKIKKQQTIQSRKTAIQEAILRAQEKKKHGFQKNN